MDETILIQVLIALDLKRRNIPDDHIKTLIIRHAALMRHVIERMKKRELHAKVEDMRTKVHNTKEI